MIMGIIFSEEKLTKQVFTGIFLLNSLFFTLFEAFQVMSSASYFKSFKNYLDMIRLPLGYIWAVISLQSEFQNVNSTNILTLVTSLLFWIEGTNAFKVFDSTRYYIWMILEVIKDTRGFIGILIYFAVAYCGMFGATVDSGFWETFKVSYNLLLGDFDNGQLDDIQWLVFIIGSLLNLVVMLNLLISIISASFEKITSERIESDTKARLNLIIEVENCLFWRGTQQEEPEYLFFIEEQQNEQEDTAKLETKVEEIRTEMESMKNEIGSMKQDIAKVLKILRNNNK